MWRPLATRGGLCRPRLTRLCRTSRGPHRCDAEPSSWRVSSRVRLRQDLGPPRTGCSSPGLATSVMRHLIARAIMPPSSLRCSRWHARDRWQSVEQARHLSRPLADLASGLVLAARSSVAPARLHPLTRDHAWTPPSPSEGVESLTREGSWRRGPLVYGKRCLGATLGLGR